MKLLWRVLWAWCLSGLALTAQAMQTVPMAHWVDEAGTATIEQVSQLPPTAFKPLTIGLTAGYTRQVHWLRVQIQAPAPDEAQQRVLYLEAQPSYLDDLRFYLPTPGGWQAFRHGDTRPFVDREVAHRHFVQRVQFDSAEPMTLYVRLQTTSSSILVLRAGNSSQLIATTTHEYALIAAFWVLLAAALVSNLVRTGWRKDTLAWAYTVYLGASILHLLGINGFVAEFIFTRSSTAMNQWVALTTWLIGLGSMVLYAVALRMWLAPRWVWVLYGVCFALCVLLLPLAMIGFYTEAMGNLLPVYLLVLLLSIGRALQLIRQGDWMARYVALALVFALFANISAVLALLGLLPGAVWLMYGYQIGMGATFLVLQLMFAKRVVEHEKAFQAMALQNLETQTKLATEQQARQVQKRFIGMLTHELKTPLSVIRMVLGLPMASASMRDHAQVAVQDIDQVIDRVALAARLEDGSMPVQRRKVDVVELVKQAAARYAADCCMLKLPNTLVLDTDPVLLQTIVNNLCSNAVKYGDAGSPITVELEAGPDACVLRVINAAASINTLAPERWFDNYYRAPEAHAQVGSGLGLAIVRDMATLLGGTVQATVAHGRVTLEVRWPV